MSTAPSWGPLDPLPSTGGPPACPKPPRPGPPGPGPPEPGGPPRDGSPKRSPKRP